MRRFAKRATKKDADRARRATHQWITVGRSRRCARCMLWDGAGVDACRGDTSQWQEVKDRARAGGHQLAAGILYELADHEREAAASQQRDISRRVALGLVGAPPGWLPGVPIVMHSVCGAFAKAGGRPQHLMEPRKPPTAKGKAALERAFMRDLHPKSGRRPSLCALSYTPIFS